MKMHSRPILLAATIVVMPLASALAQGYPVGNYADNPPDSAIPTPEANPGAAAANSGGPTAAPTGNYAPRLAIVPGVNDRIAGNHAKTDQAKGGTVRNGSL